MGVDVVAIVGNGFAVDLNPRNVLKIAKFFNEKLGDESISFPQDAGLMEDYEVYDLVEKLEEVTASSDMGITVGIFDREYANKLMVYFPIINVDKYTSQPITHISSLDDEHEEILQEASALFDVRTGVFFGQFFC